MKDLPALLHKTASSGEGSPVLSESAVSVELAREIEIRSQPVALPLNGVLFREGDPPTNMYLVTNGEITFTIYACGRVVPCFTIGKGFFIGLSAIISHVPHALTATASRDAQLLQIDADQFLGMIESRTEWYMCALRSLAEETLRANHALAEMLAS